MATYRIDQATPGVGTAGRSRIDLIAGETVTFTATDPAPGAGVTYTWEIVDSAGSAPVLSSTSGTSVTVNQVHMVAPCAGSVKLTANDNGTITSTTRKYAVPGPLTGVILPLIGERTTAGQSLGSNTPDDSTDNAVYPDRAGRGISGQNWRGWAEILHRLASGLETAAAKLRGRAVRDVLPTDGQVLTWVDADAWWEPQTPAVAPGGAGGDGSFIFQPGGTPGDNVYDDFALLYADASAADNPVVKIDAQFGTVTMPAGTYNFSGWTFRSAGLEQAQLVLEDGVDVEITGGYAPIKFENLLIQSDDNWASPPFHAEPATAYQATLFIEAVDTAFYGDTINNVGMFGFAPVHVASGGNLNVTLKGNSIVATGTIQVDNTNAAVNVGVYAYDIGALAEDAVFGTADITYVQRSLYADFPAQINLTGTATYGAGGFSGVRERHILNGTQTGTAELLIGSIYLEEGTVLLATSTAMIGTVAGGGDKADLLLRDFTGGTLLTSWTATGALQNVGLAADAVAPASDWYDVFLAAGGAAQVAMARGMKLNMYVRGTGVGG
jgi:hypothetical protein